MPIPLTDTVVAVLRSDLSRGQWSPITLRWFSDLIREHNGNTQTLVTIEESVTIVASEFDLSPRVEVPFSLFFQDLSPLNEAGVSGYDLNPRSEYASAEYRLEPV